MLCTEGGESMSNLAVDVILGDEIRAAQTVAAAMMGKPVSASSAADAAITIGADALMFVPGLGSAAAAYKAGRAAKTAAKGIKAAQTAKKATQVKKETSWAKEAVKKGNVTRVTTKQAAKYDQAVSKLTKANQKAAEAQKKLRMEGNPTERAFTSRRKAELEKRAAAKKKRNSPKRKKMRYTGNVVSTTKDIMDYARYRDSEE
jgi:hypothetical protein